jgi:excisionase family DNA binding protein
MARVFKPTYPKPVPTGAKIVNIDGRPHARFRRGGKAVTAPLTEDGTRVLLETRKWYVEVRDAAGVLKKVAGFTDKEATQQLAAELERRAARQQVGLVDPYEVHRRRPLAEHLIDFQTALRAKGNSPDYVELVVSRLRALADGCGWRTLDGLSASQAEEWLDRQRAPGTATLLPAGRDAFTPGETALLLGVSPAAVRAAVQRHHLDAAGSGKARRFPRATVEALVDRQGQGMSAQTRNYFRHVEAENTTTDRRHDRRELEADELRRLLAVARSSNRVFRGLDGRDRYHLYAAACGTGFRAAALASLVPESFVLDADPPTVTLAARRNKSRVVKVQPLPADVAELLRGYLDGRAPGEPLWGGTWARDGRGAEMLRLDLEAASIPYEVEGPDGPLFADFHSLRHTYLTLGGRAGIDLRTLQELAGHSTPILTARYSHRRLYDLAGAVEKLPSFLPPENNGVEAHVLRATGTDSAAAQGDEKHVVQHVGAPRISPHRAAPTCTSDQDKAEGGNSRESLKKKPLGTDLHQEASSYISEGDGTRTRNHRIDSPVL